MAFDQAWIGWDSYLDGRDAFITASGTSPGFNPISLANWMPWDYWQGQAGSGYVQVDCGVSRPVDYLAIGAHNLFSAAATARLLGSNSETFSTFVELAEVSLVSVGGIVAYGGTFTYDGETAFNDLTVDGDPVLCFKLAQQTFRYYRLTYSGASVPVRLGVVAIGPRMSFEMGFYGGFTPPKWNEEADVVNVRSETGVFLGRSVLRSGVKQVNLSVEPVTHAWVDAVWMPFKKHATVKPFFFAWGETPTENNVFALQASWSPSKVKNRLHASVGMRFDGVTK